MYSLVDSFICKNPEVTTGIEADYFNSINRLVGRVGGWAGAFRSTWLLDQGPSSTNNMEKIRWVTIIWLEPMVMLGLSY